MATINDNALSSSGVNGPTGISSASGNPPQRYNMSSRSRLSFDYDRYKTELIHISPSASPTDQGHHMSSDSTSAASLVFNIAELLELILLSLPGNTTHEEIGSARTILLCRTTSHTWHDLIKTSTPVRQRLYLSTNSHASALSPWQEKSSFPPARPNPWTPNLLLNRRSWGSAYPFDNSYSAFNLVPSRPKLWTFSFEMDRAQYNSMPASGSWRDMLVTSPPFADFWYTRSSWELGSGRAPFVTHWDFDPKLPKDQQQYRVHCKDGVTLGMIADAFRELFGKCSEARYVMVESLRSDILPSKDRA